MKLNWSQIIEGHRNHLFPPEKIKEFILQTSAERLEHCKTCEFNSTPGTINILSGCKACGCPLIQKSKCLSCKCGIEIYNDNNLIKKDLKWEAVATPLENQEIQNI